MQLIEKITKNRKRVIKKLTNNEDKLEILKKGFSFILFRGCGLALGYVFIIFITNYYGAAVWGLMTLCFTIFLFAGIFGRLGFDLNLVKFYSRKENLLEEPGIFFKALLISLLVSSTISFGLYLIRDVLIYDVFKKSSLEPYIVWILGAVPLWSIVLICGAVQRAKKNNKWFAFLDNPGRFFFSLAIIIILFFINRDPLHGVKAHFYALLVLSIIAFVKTLGSFEKISFKSNKSFSHFFKESFPMMISSSILVIMGGLDTIVLGIYEHEEVLAIYNVALKISTLTILSLQAVNSILAPKIAKYYLENNMGEVKKTIRFATRINFIVTLGVVIFIVVFHKFLLGVFGEAFIEGGKVLIILCVGQLINSMSGSVGIILQMIGKQKIYQNIVLFALLLNVILNFTLVPIYGVIGAALATVISLASWNILGAYYLKKRVNIISYFGFKF